MIEEPYRCRAKNRAQRVRGAVPEAFEVSPDVEVSVGDDEDEGTEKDYRSNSSTQPAQRQASSNGDHINISTQVPQPIH
jgi:hypothetical protein